MKVLVYLKQGSVEVESDSRLKLAVQAISLGADVETSATCFVGKSSKKSRLCLKNNGYTVSNNVRFKQCRSQDGK